MQTVAEVKAAIERLSPAEIEELAAWLDQYLQSLEIDPEIEAAWSAEIERRIADVKSGRAKFLPGEQVLENLRKVVGR